MRKLLGTLAAVVLVCLTGWAGQATQQATKAGQTTSSPPQPETANQGPVVEALAKQLEQNPNFMNSPMFKKLSPDLQAAIVTRAAQDSVKQTPKAQANPPTVQPNPCQAQPAKKKKSTFLSRLKEKEQAKAEKMAQNEENKEGNKASTATKGSVDNSTLPSVDDVTTSAQQQPAPCTKQ